MKSLFFYVFCLIPMCLFSQIEDDLILHYPFSGDAQDRSGNGLHPEVFGASLTEDRFGNANAAYMFDGVDDFMEVSKNRIPLFTEKPFTIALWVKKLSPSSNWSNSFIMTQWGQGSKTKGVNQWSMSLCNDGHSYRPGMGYECGYEYRRLSAPKLANLNEWYFFTAVFDGEALFFYINDVKLLSHELGEKRINTSKQDLRIGRNSQNKILYTHMALDDVRIYSKALSREEISTLYTMEPTEPMGNVVEKDNEIDILLYPNPAQNHIQIKTSLNNIGWVQIYDIKGRLVLKSIYNQNFINISGLSSGLYLIQFIDEKGNSIEVQKFMKTKHPQV